MNAVAVYIQPLKISTAAVAIAQVSGPGPGVKVLDVAFVSTIKEGGVGLDPNDDPVVWGVLWGSVKRALIYVTDETQEDHLRALIAMTGMIVGPAPTIRRAESLQAIYGFEKYFRFRDEVLRAESIRDKALILARFARDMEPQIRRNAG